MSSTACKSEKTVGERPVSYLLKKVADFLLEPAEVDRRQLSSCTSEAGALNIGLVPLGPEIDCSKVQLGLARVLNKGSSAIAEGSAGDNQPKHVKICESQEQTAPSDDLDVVVLIAGNGSVPRISALSRRSLLDRGISSLLVYRGDIESYESDGWKDVADQYLPESRVAERMGETISLPWSRYSLSLQRLAWRCLELTSIP